MAGTQVETPDGLRPIEQLAAGDLVQAATGAALLVANLKWSAKPQIAYHIAVDELHTYIVGEGAAWLHDCPVGADASDVGGRASGLGPVLPPARACRSLLH